MSIGLKSDSSGTSGSIVINGSDAVLVTPTGITTASIQNSSITTAKIADANITFGKLSTSATEADNVASRTAKAWVNFDGTFASSPFTIANGGIRASFNVSSVTDNGPGNYTVNFASAFSDVNYTVNGFHTFGNLSILMIDSVANNTVNGSRLNLRQTDNNQCDAPFISVVYFR